MATLCAADNRTWAPQLMAGRQCCRCYWPRWMALQGLTRCSAVSCRNVRFAVPLLWTGCSRLFLSTIGTTRYLRFLFFWVILWPDVWCTWTDFCVTQCRFVVWQHWFFWFVFGAVWKRIRACWWIIKDVMVLCFWVRSFVCWHRYLRGSMFSNWHLVGCHWFKSR